jgi:N-acetyl-gamma-glutamyl-phosphate reductase
MSDSTIRVGLVGVTGYTGMELTRILALHPRMELVRATSRKEAGMRLDAFYPSLRGFKPGELIISEPDPADLAKACDVVFLAIPHGAAMETAGELLAAGCKVVDLSADFRLRDPAVYTQWYKVEHTRTKELTEAVYGLPELYAEAMKKARLIANPGCYPTASILALHPALKAGFIKPEGLVIDAKSGATGAGRGASVPTLFCEVSDSFKAYGLASHRHTPEIEQELGLAAGRPLTLSFNPHLLPINRGILATIYAELATDVPLDDIQALYEETYAPHPFVRVLPKGELPLLRSVRGTMFCDIALVKDPRTNRLILVSCIDNLCRGASGQAVAGANLMCGLPLETGLQFAPLVP